MTTRLRRRLLVDGTWFLGLAVVGSALVGGSVHALESRKARVVEQRARLESQERDLASTLTESTELEQLEAARALLAESRRMLSSDAQRVELLSQVAGEAGVEFFVVRSGVDWRSADGAVAAKSHELGVRGDYRQLATFLEGLHAADGIVGIDGLEIEPEPASRGDGGLLRASLEVVWYAQGTEEVGG